MLDQYTVRAAERFWVKVDRNGPIPVHCPELEACWIWLSACLPDGRGQFHFRGRTEYAATISYILTYGPLPTDRPWVLHKCDGGTLCCVRPDHLFAGTHADNMADMTAKGRHPAGNWMKTKPERIARGVRSGASTHPECIPRGSKHPQAILNETLVTEARARYAAGGVTIRALAEHAGVSMMTMYNAIKRKTWVHVP